ncbi:hypothetical protein GCM10009789_61560 [Kribbella sancticallisti]|uniref:PknH-like extracellular domain-containing protein n=1 Tax=Kribbella sancticallisti TaxID=460087 RepID=A0ABP4Q2U2_9ACTN
MKLAWSPLALAAALSLSLTACGDDKSSASTTPSSTPSAVATPADPTPTETPTETGPVKRTSAELTKALLELKDLPTGFTLVPDEPDDEDVIPFSSSAGKCKPLVKFLNADKAPGSKANAHRSFTGGQEGPYIDFSLDSMNTSTAVGKLQTSYREAVESCQKVTMRVAEQGSSPMAVEEITAPQFGEGPFAFKLTGSSGPLEGREFTMATTGVGDVIVAVGIMAGQQGELDGATEAAVEKARAVLAK